VGAVRPFGCINPRLIGGIPDTAGRPPHPGAARGGSRHGCRGELRARPGLARRGAIAERMNGAREWRPLRESVRKSSGDRLWPIPPGCVGRRGGESSQPRGAPMPLAATALGPARRTRGGPAAQDVRRTGLVPPSHRRTGGPRPGGRAGPPPPRRRHERPARGRGGRGARPGPQVPRWTPEGPTGRRGAEAWRRGASPSPSPVGDVGGSTYRSICAWRSMRRRAALAPSRRCRRRADLWIVLARRDRAIRAPEAIKPIALLVDLTRVAYGPRITNSYGHVWTRSSAHYAARFPSTRLPAPGGTSSRRPRVVWSRGNSVAGDRSSRRPPSDRRSAKANPRHMVVAAVTGARAPIRDGRPRRRAPSRERNSARRMQQRPRAPGN
jgi:hypothetical protein